MTYGQRKRAEERRLLRALEKGAKNLAALPTEQREAIAATIAAEQRARESCEDCGRPIYWDEKAGDFRHVTEPERGCFLISAQGYASRPHGDNASPRASMTPEQWEQFELRR
jgi:hypothetical protein